MNNDKPIDYKFIPPFINPDDCEAALHVGFGGVSIFNCFIRETHIPIPKFVLNATLENIEKNYETLLNASSEEIQKWKKDTLSDIAQRALSRNINYAQKVKNSIGGASKKNIDEKKAILFNLLFCLLFKAGLNSSQKLAKFKTLVVLPGAELNLYKDYTAAATFDKTQYSDPKSAAAARRTFAATKHLHLLELGVLCLNKTEHGNQNDIFDFIKYLHLEKGFSFDTKKENTGFVSSYSPAYKILFELESAIEKSLEQYCPNTEKWAKPLIQCLQDNQDYSIKNRPAIQDYLQDAFEDSKGNEKFLLEVQSLIDDQCQRPACSF